MSRAIGFHLLRRHGLTRESAPRYLERGSAALLTGYRVFAGWRFPADEPWRSIVR
jgi:hypothetical protein